MTRDSKTISAVFMAVVLILASGTAVSLAVSDSSTSDVGTNAVAAQDETTTAEDGVETTEEVGVETTEAVDVETTTEEDVETTVADEEPSASITFNEQESEGNQFVIESVTMEEGGFIGIHDSSYEDTQLASVLGSSAYLEPGTHEDVTVTVARPVEETQSLVAVPYHDTNDNQVFDYYLSDGNLDGPYTADGEAVVDEAEVSVAQDTTTTTEEVEETTTTEEEVVDETTTEEEVIEETTTEEEVVETTTEEVIEETTTEEDVIDETTTEEDVIDETTTTEEVVDETTTEEVVEEPAEQQQFIFKVEQMQIDEWSFVVGDEEEPDRTEVVSDVTFTDRRIEINLTEMLQQQAEMADQQVTTMAPEEAQEQLEEEFSGDLQTVRFVIRNVNIENVTFVVTAPADMDLPQPPMTTTTEEDVVDEETTTVEVIEETTTEEEVVEETTTTEEDVIDEETTTEEEVVDETTTEEEVVEETTTEEEVVVETTTEEDVDEIDEETTTEEDVIEETTTEEDVVDEETTTEEEVVEETTTTEEVEAELDSFNVSGLDAPSNATVGDTISVTATIINPNDEEVSQDVAFRLQGNVIERQSVTLDANEQSTVTFEVDTSEMPPGQYVHGVYTQDFGELAVIVLDDPTAETTETETDASEDEEAVTTTTTEEA